MERLYRLPSNPKRIILLEDLIKRYSSRVFHKFKVEGKLIFQVIRNADIDENDGLYDYDPDFLETMTKIVEVRSFRAPIKLNYQGNHIPKMLNYLSKALGLRKMQLFEYESPLSFDFMEDLERLFNKKERSKVIYPAYKASHNPVLDYSGDLMSQILEKDILMSYPFESIDSMVKLLEQASRDERVSEISMTLYRAAKHSKIVAALIAASKHGKKVTCVVELRARFDEHNNIRLAEELQAAGVKVIYGLSGYKVHSKILLIELSDDKKISLIGTGNFNESTARFYTDVALMTAKPELTTDVKSVFESIEAGGFVQQTKALLVSPLLMKSKILELIGQQTELAKSGKSARIVMKMNSLTEKEVMKKLIEASKAGVKIDLIVRGICCILPGVKGETENIHLRSIVGRYLEHSRIFAFGSGEESPIKYYISSADIMTRNLTGRVEVATPIYDENCQRKLQGILDLCLADNVKARIGKSSGKYVLPKLGKKTSKIESQVELMNLAKKNGAPKIKEGKAK